MQPKSKQQRKQKKAGKPKQQQTIVARKTPLAPRNIGVPKRIVSQVCGLVDPFCEHAQSAKYPDQSSVRTLTYTYHKQSGITTDGSGTALRLYYPQYSAEMETSSATNTGDTALTWNNFTAVTLVSGVQSYRIVSAGIRLKRTSAPLYSSGTVMIRVWPQENLSSFAPISLSSYNSSYSLDIPLQDLTDTTIILPHNSQLPQNFYPISGDSAAVTTATGHGFCPVTVGLFGGPASTSSILVEYIIHYELIFDDNVGLSQAATPPPPSDSLITTAASQVSSTLIPIAKQGVNFVAKEVARKAGEALSTLLFGRTRLAGSAIARLVD